MTTPTAPTPTPAELRADAEQWANTLRDCDTIPIGVIRTASIVADLAAHIERLTAENDALIIRVATLATLAARHAATTARLADRVAHLDAAANYPGIR